MGTLDDLLNNRTVKTPDSHNPNDVMPRMCATCPFRGDSNAIGSEYGAETQQLLQSALAASALTEDNRLCHASGLKGQPETKVCRGARNLQIQYFFALGVLDAPTDQAWREALTRLSVQYGENQ